MEYRCPKCNSPIYSRKNKLCGKCGSILPEELLFNAKQTKFIEGQIQDSNIKRRDFHLPDGSDSSISGGSV
jgi:hypothetical protein